MVRSAGAGLGTRSRIGLTPSRVRRFQTNSVVDCVSEPLFAAEVSFSRLNTDMTEQKLDLFKLSARIMAQTGAGATKIVRRNPIQTAFQGSRLHDAPDHLRTECARANTLGLIDRAKNRTRRDTGGSQPAIHRALDPNRHWHSAHVPAFADEIRDHPVLFSLLEVFHGKPGHLRPPEAATEQNRDHGVVTSASYILATEHLKEPLTLIGRQPIPDAHAMLLYALDPPDSGRKVGTQKPAIGSLVGKSPNGGEPQVDSGGGIYLNPALSTP
jgi:hypothetical protein